jgi:hypothetical protein
VRLRVGAKVLTYQDATYAGLGSGIGRRQRPNTLMLISSLNKQTNKKSLQKVARVGDVRADSNLIKVLETVRMCL